ncbi:hypothetical protein GCM10010357_61000 [Streptomyces luteireticuli]|uniref:Uncharacterized protein n=1 Tax=Streptomyces luteireticuli TaxID=173858 RepID=A0ABP3IWY3_9ACTN
MPTPPFSLPHSGGQWMVPGPPPSSRDERETVSASPEPLCRGCVSVGSELQAASKSGDEMGLHLALARTGRHLANWHGKGTVT